MQAQIKKSIEESADLTKSLLEGDFTASVEKAAKTIIRALGMGGKVIAFGNGGSAADSQHFVAELVGRFKKERKAIPAVALTTNTSTLTALANDYNYDIVFARQVEALGNKDDVVFAISTSGESKCVIDGVKKAKEMGLGTIALTGKSGGSLSGMADISIVVKSNSTPRIQEAHVLVLHILAGLIEENL